MIGVGFDFDHTLGTDGGLERRAFYELAREAGKPLDPEEPAPRAEIDALLAAIRDRKTSIDDAVAEFGTMWELHADAARWRAICEGLVDELVRPIDGAVELLATLRARGVRSAILTNGWSPLQPRKIARALGDVAPPVLVSDAIGVQKPDARAFDALVAALDVPRANVWYVGDNACADVAGALAAGLRAVWFDAESAAYPDGLAAPTARITRLRDLGPLIENAIDP